MDSSQGGFFMSLLKENTYDVPNEIRERVKYAISKVWIGLIALVPMIFGWAWYGAYKGFVSEGSLILLGLTLITLTLIVQMFIQKYNNAKFSYEVLGVTITFQSPKYYVPKKLMKGLIERSVIKPMMDSEYMKENFPRIEERDITEGLVAHIVDQRPDPSHPRLTSREENEVVGVTRPYQGVSQIYGPYALKAGATGHELRLQVCANLFPFRPEEKDLEWMREQGIID
jgi:hypothetical protein